MQKILNADTKDLSDDQLNHETVDLGSSNLDTVSINLESDSLDPIASNTVRLTEIEKIIGYLQSCGNVRYDLSQILTEEQKQTVKKNIGIVGSGEVLINTTKHWNSMIGFVPDAGSIIIYVDKDIVDGKNVPGIKIGSGNAYIQDLAFVNQSLENDLFSHINNTDIHVSLQDKSRWDNKVNIDDRVSDIQGEVLIFTRAF